MRAIPGTITEYGIEGKIEASKAKPAAVFAVKVTRDGQVLRIITGEHGTPLTLAEARDLVDSGNLVDTHNVYSVINLR